MKTPTEDSIILHTGVYLTL